MNKKLIQTILILIIFNLFSIGNLFAENFDLTIKPGVQFISIPLNTSWNIKSIFSQVTANSKQAAYWDAANNKYLMYANDPMFDEFSTFEFGKGYWIHLDVSQPVTITLSNTTPAIKNLPLKKGWNSIGCPRNKDVLIEEALSPMKLGVDYESVWCYTSTSYPWYQEYSQNKKEFTHLKPGEGYWIEMLKDKTWVIKYDRTPPSGSISINNNAAYTDKTAVTLALSVQDNSGGSGISHMQFSNDGSSWSAVEAYKTTKDWTLTTGDGTKTVYAKFRDNAKNWSGAVSTSITLDSTRPNITAFKPKDGESFYKGDSITLGVTAVEDTDPSPVTYRFLIDGTVKRGWNSSPSHSWNTTQATEGLHKIKFQVKDTGGTSTKQVEIWIYYPPVAPPQ